MTGQIALNDKRKINWKDCTFWTGMYVFWVFVFLCSPLISDDFEFAGLQLTKPEEVLKYVLYYGNGRLLGNIGAVYLINYKLPCVLLQAAMVSGIIYMIPRVLRIPMNRYAGLAFLLVLGMAPSIFSQVFTWTSGFMNYVPPVLLMLLCADIVCNSENVTRGRMGTLFVLAAAAQLYVEHASIVHIAAALLALLVACRDKNATQKKYAAIWLAGAVVGLIIMFAIPKIFYIENNRTGAYRAINTTDLGTLIGSAVGGVFLIIITYSHCCVLWIFLSILGLALNRERGGLMRKAKLAVYILYPAVVLLFYFLDSTTGLLKLGRYLLVYGGGFVFLLLLAFDILRSVDRKTCVHMLWLWFLAALSLAPFLIVRPFGERCVFLSYILVSMSVLKLLSVMAERNAWKITKLDAAAKLSALVIALLLCVEYVSIYQADAERDRHIRECMKNGDREIVVYELESDYAFATYLLNRYYYYEEYGDISFTIINWKYEQSVGDNKLPQQ